MRRQAGIVLYVLTLVAVVVGVDILFLRNHLWVRLIINIGIVLVFVTFYLRFLKRPAERPPQADLPGSTANPHGADRASVSAQSSAETSAVSAAPIIRAISVAAHSSNISGTARNQCILACQAAVRIGAHQAQRTVKASLIAVLSSRHFALGGEMISWVVWAIFVSVTVLLGFAGYHFNVRSLRYVALTTAIVLAGLITWYGLAHTTPVPVNLQDSFTQGADAVSSALLHPLRLGHKVPAPAKFPKFAQFLSAQQKKDYPTSRKPTPICGS